MEPPPPSDVSASLLIDGDAGIGFKRPRSSISMDLPVKSSKPELNNLMSKFVRTSSSDAPIARIDAPDVCVLLEASKASYKNQQDSLLHSGGTSPEPVSPPGTDIDLQKIATDIKHNFSSPVLVEASGINQGDNAMHPRRIFSDDQLMLETSDPSYQIHEEENKDPCTSDFSSACVITKGSHPKLSGLPPKTVPSRSLSKFNDVLMRKPPGLTAKPRGVNAVFRAPIAVSKSHENGSQSAKICGGITVPSLSSSPPAPAHFYCVMYRARKKNAKNRGPWVDGILIVRGRKSSLLDTEGKTVCKGDISSATPLEVDAIIELSKYQIEVMRVASSQEYEKGSIFTGSFEHSSKHVEGKKKEEVMHGSHESNDFLKSLQIRGPNKLKSFREHSQTLPPQSLSEDALILNQCCITEAVGPVIVDPYIATKLRPHQRDGVRFMYECVMGLRAPLFTGCLLADEMGLGKTLQVIALIWTLIHQKPGNKPFKHVIVVCPSSLVQNWGNEVRKWLGSERLKALVVHAGLQKEAEQRFLDFKIGKTHPLLITSYELLRKHQELIASSKPELLVCDEAHRLKNSAGNKTIDSLLALSCHRRVLLTGTPIQNDLNEFFAMIDFANPNLLGPLSAFKRLYAEPIELSRDRDASDEQRQVGQARFLELQARTKFCILRRTAAVNKTYLPAKTQYLVFCPLQPLQVTLYESYARSQFVTRLFVTDSSSANVLTAIGVLRKLCNHPKLVIADMPKELLGPLQGLSSLKDSDNKEFTKEDPSFGQHGRLMSGKLECMVELLSAVFDPQLGDKTERVVVVSNFTQTLNLVQGVCEEKGWGWLRLDGSTMVGDRQQLVDRFNSSFGEERVFLLSSKAGGMGLNLVGANRLILFDPDWNPATDAQAMARIWREGQRKPVIIYRLFSTGSIEEKIYQRQMVKGEIAATVDDNVESRKKCKGGRYFSREELRELFTLNMETMCETHDLLCGRGLPVEEQWRDCSEQVEDPALKKAIKAGLVSFVQERICHHRHDT